MVYLTPNECEANTNHYKTVSEQLKLREHSMLKGFLMLIGFQLAGEAISIAGQIPVPGPVIGMILLFLTLLISGIPVHLAKTSASLLPYLPLFLIPASVGVMKFTSLLENEFWAILLALVISLTLSFLLTPLIMKGFMALNSRLDGKQT